MYQHFLHYSKGWCLNSHNHHQVFNLSVFHDLRYLPLDQVKTESNLPGVKKVLLKSLIAEALLPPPANDGNGFYTCLSVILFTGVGWCTPLKQTAPRQTPPPLPRDGH